MPVYFIRAGDTEMVKIGGTATNPEARMANLQIGHYEELHLIRVMDVSHTYEQTVQGYFADQWVRGEWFRFSPEMMTVDLGDLGNARNKAVPALLERRMMGIAKGIATRLAQLNASKKSAS